MKTAFYLHFRWLLFSGITVPFLCFSHFFVIHYHQHKKISNTILLCADILLFTIFPLRHKGDNTRLYYWWRETMTTEWCPFTPSNSSLNFSTRWDKVKIRWELFTSAVFNVRFHFQIWTLIFEMLSALGVKLYPYIEAQGLTFGTQGG